jgi:hypothetical protein
VTQLPISLLNVTVNPANKDQYKATLDFNQLLYNGGLIDANTKIKEAQTKTAATARSEFISTENENKSAVFSILLLQERAS